MPTEPNARPRDPDAARSARFEALVVPYLDAAYNLAHWLAHNPADAQDVVQEAMLRALRYFDSFHGGDVRVWLLAIVRNTFYTLRSRQPQDALHDELDDEVHPLVDNAPSPEALTLLAVDVGALQAALERLPASLREILVLRELEECSYKEIATITGQKIGTVMSRLARARERLRNELTCRPKEVRRHDVR
ncbi:sigma-70 family RNA polymerase sigma factor [Dyella terrae]|uniref:sigma-70 family RNA polymerase sigma factor n=1 Tax=Dyella terrae TaxID=522259 RepID=UPI001EFE77E5|nr:sigma-70 family RNA polymerase sigma factor [Dyella terrae]ULU24825.1 sigma-70 family RNA polymerase sigma factor [Dyella terrae]